VTGVQTCALPICTQASRLIKGNSALHCVGCEEPVFGDRFSHFDDANEHYFNAANHDPYGQIEDPLNGYLIWELGFQRGRRELAQNRVHVTRPRPVNSYRDSNVDCTIEVKFDGNKSARTPRFATGPNHKKLGQYTGTLKLGDKQYTDNEFRFEVTGWVNGGTVGRIGDEHASTSIALNGGGSWTIGQWKYPFPESNRNGEPVRDAGKTTDDSPRYLSGEFKNVAVYGHGFAWNDGPGLNSVADNQLTSGTYKTNFIVYAQNGDKRCAVSFHIVGTFKNGVWKVTIGQGLL